MKLNELTIFEAREGLRKGKFSSTELTKACLAQIKRIDKKIKAFITVCEKSALDQARKADAKIRGYEDTKNLFKQKPLLGIPIGIKDNFCTEGIRTTAASKVLTNYIPQYDAMVVKKLKKAGALILGKTNMDAWAHGSSTETSQFFTTRNPWDLTRLPGGSSGGSAAAIAADQLIAAIGSETAGSIRQPAAWCGVVGLKPTYGRVSRYGVIAMASSTDSPGPITKTVKDSALILSLLAGSDGCDATLSPKPVPDYMKQMKKGIKGLKVGIAKEYFSSAIDNDVLMKTKKAIGVLEKLGAKIETVSLLDPKYAIAVYTIIQRSEVSSNLARYDGIRYGLDRSEFGDEAKRRIMLGTYALSAGYYDQYYKKAQKVRNLLVKDFERVFNKVDLLVAPTSPSIALKVGSSADEPMFGELQDVLVEASSLAGLPGVSLNCGFSKRGLPIGFQIFGPQFSEGLILSAAFAYEQATEWHLKKPDLEKL